MSLKGEHYVLNVHGDRIVRGKTFNDILDLIEDHKYTAQEAIIHFGMDSSFYKHITEKQKRLLQASVTLNTKFGVGNSQP